MIGVLGRLETRWLLSSKEWHLFRKKSRQLSPECWDQLLCPLLCGVEQTIVGVVEMPTVLLVE